MKRKFPSELSYFLGLTILALGVVFMEKSDFGVSMIVAPAYLLFRWLNPHWSFFTFGMAEYCLQGTILTLMAIVLRRFSLSWLFSFVTALIYGFILDTLLALFSFLPTEYLWQQGLYYVIGSLIGPLGVALMFHTYIPAEVYELFVKTVALETKGNIGKVKTIYDLCSCTIAIVMSFLIFGLWKFEGVKWGTLLCATFNGYLVGTLSSYFDRTFEFVDILPFRKYFNS
ncbi:MAG: hypothetical protein HUK24_01620 [Sphaerochaetaceae bacterium]|nr:hypothetical protein [Sphaerochaetaceae bacterium]